MDRSAPIGLFDSGVGGLSVAAEIRRTLPAESLLYVADTAWCPYGDRPLEDVRARALAVGRELERAGAKLVVVACNTASGAALEALRETLSVPIVGLEPAVKTAVAKTRNGRIGVMATSGTLRSERFARLVRTHASDVTVVAQACPGLADLVEQGHLDDDVLDGRLHTLVASLVSASVDTVVLGCTHYAFVQGPIARALGGAVEIVDSAPAIARRAAHLLKEGGLLAGPGDPGSFRLLTTAEPARVRPVVDRLVTEPVTVDPLALP